MQAGYNFNLKSCNSKCILCATNYLSIKHLIITVVSDKKYPRHLIPKPVVDWNAFERSFPGQNRLIVGQKRGYD